MPLVQKILVPPTLEDKYEYEEPVADDDVISENSIEDEDHDEKKEEKLSANETGEFGKILKIRK